MIRHLRNKMSAPAGPVRLGNLAAAEQVRPPTMTRIVDALEERGLITRQCDETDGRSIRLLATAAGKAFLAEGRKRRVDALEKQIASLNARDRQTLRRAAEIVAALTRAMP